MVSMVYSVWSVVYCQIVSRVDKCKKIFAIYAGNNPHNTVLLRPFLHASVAILPSFSCNLEHYTPTVTHVTIYTYTISDAQQTSMHELIVYHLQPNLSNMTTWFRKDGVADKRLASPRRQNNAARILMGVMV